MKEEEGGGHASAIADTAAGMHSCRCGLHLCVCLCLSAGFWASERQSARESVFVWAGSSLRGVWVQTSLICS